MKKGVIIKGIAGFYYVMAEGDLYECKARGKLKNLKVTPLVGDSVRISIQDEAMKLGTVEELMERKLELLRPQVANVDQAVIVFAAHIPDPNPVLLDKLTVLAEYSDLDIVIVMNKCDIDPENNYVKYKAVYEGAGYRFIKASALTGEGIKELRDALRDKISVFCGQSGVGKSSLLNAIECGLQLQTGDLSKKTKKGKHTTRHSELFTLSFGGYVVDTPGFSSLDLDFIGREEMTSLFPEFNDVENCRFQNCLHMDEPSCGVKDAVSEGSIVESRYESYRSFMELSNNGGKYGTNSTVNTIGRFRKSGKGSKQHN